MILSIISYSFSSIPRTIVLALRQTIRQEPAKSGQSHSKANDTMDTIPGSRPFTSKAPASEVCFFVVPTFSPHSPRLEESIDLSYEL